MSHLSEECRPLSMQFILLLRIQFLPIPQELFILRNITLSPSTFEMGLSSVKGHHGHHGLQPTRVYTFLSVCQAKYIYLYIQYIYLNICLVCGNMSTCKVECWCTASQVTKISHHAMRQIPYQVKTTDFQYGNYLRTTLEQT